MPNRFGITRPSVVTPLNGSASPCFSAERERCAAPAAGVWVSTVERPIQQSASATAATAAHFEGFILPPDLG
jgi:hypothetical protein